MTIEVRNYTKIRVLLYLRQVDTMATEPTEGFPFGEGGAYVWRAPATIAQDTGVSVASLYTILKRWRSFHWGYASGRLFTAAQTVDKRPHWLYKINSRGYAYLARLHNWYKAEAEVKAALLQYQESIGCNFGQWGLAPCGIAWRIRPSEWVVINYPFESRGDAGKAAWAMDGYEVRDIREAVYTTRSVFHIMPKRDCLAEAQAIQAYFTRQPNL